MRESTFSSVLLPAPFGPTMPITSPTPTRKETSFNAQNVVFPWPLAAICLNRRHGPVTQEVIDSPSVLSPMDVVPIAYCLPSFSMTMASDDIGEPALHVEEVADARHEHHCGGRAGGEDHGARKRSAEHARTEAGDHPHHRIQCIQLVPLRGNDVERV